MVFANVNKVFSMIALQHQEFSILYGKILLTDLLDKELLNIYWWKVSGRLLNCSFLCLHFSCKRDKIKSRKPCVGQTIMKIHSIPEFCALVKMKLLSLHLKILRFYLPQKCKVNPSYYFVFVFNYIYGNLLSQLWK